MKRQRPTVWPVWGGTRARAELNGAWEGEAIVVDSAAWFEWLAAETTHGFAYALFDRQAGYVRGFLTVRKERRARGGSYWVVYRRAQGQLWKRYLGSASRLTYAELETIGEAALTVRAGSIKEGGACDQQTR
jgi:LuxR family transcriptional regulator, maltose regulon positive regulatory protein